MTSKPKQTLPEQTQGINPMFKTKSIFLQYQLFSKKSPNILLLSKDIPLSQNYNSNNNTDQTQNINNNHDQPQNNNNKSDLLQSNNENSYQLLNRRL